MAVPGPTPLGLADWKSLGMFPQLLLSLSIFKNKTGGRRRQYRNTQAQQRREDDAESHLGMGDTRAEGEPLGWPSISPTHAQSALNAGKHMLLLRAPSWPVVVNGASRAWGVKH